MPFLPTIDGEFELKRMLSIDSDITAAGRSFFATLDFLSGINAEEGLSMKSPIAGVEDPENFEPNRAFFEQELLTLTLPQELGEDIPE